jgi:hypothetical protein
VAGELVPRRITREQLERIIQRAAELQAGEMDTGEGMTEQELLKLGSDVGIPGRFLRQAMYEEGAGARVPEKGLLAKWFGPGTVGAGRVVPGDKAQIEAALGRWMIEDEALTVKRRLPDRTVWEKQRGFFAEMKRGFGAGGRGYVLAKANDVSAAVTELESGYCHVELSADVSLLRNGAIRTGVASSGALVVLGGGALTLASAVVVAPVAVGLGVILLGATAAAPPLAGRMQKARSAQVQLALEQVLDRLEHGEIRSRPQLEGPRASAFMRIASEIKRSVDDVADTFRQPPGAAPPNAKPPRSSGR